MFKSLLVAVTVVAALSASGCGGLNSSDDETLGWSAQKIYGEAKDAMAGKDWPKAIKYLERLEARYPYGRYAQQAQLEVAFCYWKEDERASAVAAVDRFIKLYPNHLNADYAWYLKGLINFNENIGMLWWLTTPDLSDRDPRAAREAFEAFKEVVTRFPESKYTPDATARMRYIVNALAQYEVHVARYYMRRGAYLAAANRAQYAIKTYQKAPAVEDAVFMLVKAYEAMNMPELRDGAARIMTTNFPDSRYLKAGDIRPDVPWWRIWDPNW